MKIGIFTVLYPEMNLDQLIDKVQSFGVKAIELGIANYPQTNHLNELQTDSSVEMFLNRMVSSGIEISALSCQGNPLHPNVEVAQLHHNGWRLTLEWAKRLNVRTVNVFSGCPGTPAGGDYPNWVTTAWPPEFRDLLNWQWDKRLIPYWIGESEAAAKQGVDQIAFEMHPGFAVYNPYTLVKLRRAVGPQIGANFDPSHLFWQGIDPTTAIRFLCDEKALFHVHAKDVYVDPQNTALNGVLDSRPYEMTERAWTFCTVGYGHSALVWAQMVQELRKGGYDGVLSIEHEDLLASKDEGLAHAIDFLKPLIWTEPQPEMWWA